MARMTLQFAHISAFLNSSSTFQIYLTIRLLFAIKRISIILLFRAGCLHHGQYDPRLVLRVLVNADGCLLRRGACGFKLARLQVRGIKREPARTDADPDTVPLLEDVSCPDILEVEFHDLPGFEQFALACLVPVADPHRLLARAVEVERGTVRRQVDELDEKVAVLGVGR